MSPTTTQYFAGYYIPHSWTYAVCPSRDYALAKIEAWRKLGWDYPMKIITRTTTTTEETA